MKFWIVLRLEISARAGQEGTKAGEKIADYKVREVVEVKERKKMVISIRKVREDGSRGKFK
jgi:hypothetical protein